MNYLHNKLFLFAAAVCLCDCLLPFVLALFYPGYNHLTMVISSLGSKSSPVHTVFSIWMVCLGCSQIIIAILLFRDYSKIAFISSMFFIAIIFIYAIADCILSGFFAVGETKEMVTTAQKIHGYGSAIGCTIFVFIGLVCFFMLKNTNRNAAVVSLVSFIFALITFGIFIAGENIPKDAKGFMKLLSYEGLWQRVSFVFMYLPIVVTSYVKA